MPKPYYSNNSATIYHGDCLRILPELRDEAIDLVLTDPPYGLMAAPGKVQMKSGRSIKQNYGKWDTVEQDYTWLAHVPASVRSLLSFHDQKESSVILLAGRAVGFRLAHFVFWDKGDSGFNPRKNFVNTVEMAAFFTKPKYTWNGGGAQINLLRQNRAPTPLHPTQKPLVLFRKLVRILSVDGEVILDPFMGSGTTLAAAQSLGRKSIGIEIDERYCEIAARRLESLSYGKGLSASSDRTDGLTERGFSSLA